MRLHSARTFCLAVLTALTLGLPSNSQARMVAPQAAVQAVNGEEYAANVLGNPWDMDSPSDISLEFTRRNGNIANLRFEDGKLKGSAATGDPRVTLLLPSDPGVNPILPEGGVQPINTDTYRFLTVKLSVSASSYAQVFWQNGAGAAYEATTIVAVSPGDNLLTFDLRAGGQFSSGAWDGTVQGLYFDPVFTNGTSFEIDYVRLSSAVPANPDNNQPRLVITAPSYISGPDYATVELGNSWDMDSSDVVAVRKLGAYNFEGGVLNAAGEQDNNNCGGSLICGDPQITLNVGPPINAAKYKYFTYRMQLDGPQDTDLGSVSRVIWWSTIPEQATAGSPWVIYEGFQTVSSDFSRLKLEPGAFQPWSQSSPKVFRFEPHEFAAPRSFHLDYVMLTGDDQAKTNASYDIRYQASDPEGGTPTTSFFYYPAGQPGNRQPIACAANAIAAVGDVKIFLPMTVGKPSTPAAPSGSTCRWNTTGVAPGTYYIAGETTDGTDTTTTNSLTPVVLSN